MAGSARLQSRSYCCSERAARSAALSSAYDADTSPYEWEGILNYLHDATSIWLPRARAGA
jgi:hypothetical protein